MKYWRVDEKEYDVKDIFDAVVEKYHDDFADLVENCNFLFTFRDSKIFDDEGMEIAAQAKLISKRERDLYGYDFEILFYEELWSTLTRKQKMRLMFHELLHCQVDYDEDDNVAVDKDGRVVTYITPHDIVVKTFQREIELFGISPADMETAVFFSKQLARMKKSKE